MKHYESVRRTRLGLRAEANRALRNRWPDPVEALRRSADFDRMLVLQMARFSHEQQRKILAAVGMDLKRVAWLGPVGVAS